MGRNLSLRGSRWMLQPDNLRVGSGEWGMGNGAWAIVILALQCQQRQQRQLFNSPTPLLA
ncbi:MAG: hypothetical protein V7K32_02695 [Nostoc sp.]|uniref:hypothetical protein n=1 Tax=Nostoc sp. TaxID=1180 RepID=UPI002FF6622E